MNETTDYVELEILRASEVEPKEVKCCEMWGDCLKRKTMRCVSLTLSLCTAAIVTIPLFICEMIMMCKGL